MKINKLSTAGKVGILASIVVILSLFLPWVSVNVELLNMHELYDGLRIYDLEDFKYNLFPIIVMILGILSVFYFLLDTKSSASVSAVIGIALGVAIVAMSYLTYSELSKLAFDFGGFVIVTVEMSYGLLAALIGGAVVILASLMRK